MTSSSDYYIESTNPYIKRRRNMKRNISIAAAALTAVLSFTACGRVTGTNEEVSALPVVTTNTASSVAASTTTAAPSAVTATTSAAEGSSEETTAAAPDAANTESTTAASVAAGGGDQSSNSGSSNSGSAGSSNSGSGSGSTQQSAPASRDHAPSPEDYNYGPAPTQYSNDGLTYIQGVLIANKSYSLPADFNPGLDPTCQNQFYKLQNDAAAQGLNIWLSSGFRSYDYQNQIYNNYVARDGQAAADTYSARPGHSEHQSGLAIDVNQIDDSFIGTPEAIWLENHCHEYGFILRYPQGKQDITGYKYESWHIRYVGTDMSYPIHDSGLTLEEYFGIDSYYH